MNDQRCRCSFLEINEFILRYYAIVKVDVSLILLNLMAYDVDHILYRIIISDSNLDYG